MPAAVPRRAAPNAQPQRITSSVGADEKRRQELKEAKERAGGYEHDARNHGVPRTPEERLRAGVPYSGSFSLSDGGWAVP